MSVLDTLRPATAASDVAPTVDAEQLAVRRWRRGTIAVGAAASILSTVLVHLTGASGLWKDEPSHLLHASRFFDSLTPGFGQLGNYWPPLIHWAQLPFAWNAW